MAPRHPYWKPTINFWYPKHKHSHILFFYLIILFSLDSIIWNYFLKLYLTNQIIAKTCVLINLLKNLFQYFCNHINQIFFFQQLKSQASSFHIMSFSALAFLFIFVIYWVLKLSGNLHVLDQGNIFPYCPISSEASIHSY